MVSGLEFMNNNFAFHESRKNGHDLGHVVR